VKTSRRGRSRLQVRDIENPFSAHDHSRRSSRLLCFPPVPG
jgi:hypothetical protein